VGSFLVVFGELLLVPATPFPIPTPDALVEASAFGCDCDCVWAGLWGIVVESIVVEPTWTNWVSPYKSNFLRPSRWLNARVLHKSHCFGCLGFLAVRQRNASTLLNLCVSFQLSNYTRNRA